MEHLQVSMDLTTVGFDGFDSHAPNTKHAFACGAGRMPRGTKGGAPTVWIRGILEDGTDVILETTLALLGTAVDGMRAVRDEDSN